MARNLTRCGLDENEKNQFLISNTSAISVAVQGFIEAKAD
jgi:hypothetical protein